MSLRGKARAPASPPCDRNSMVSEAHGANRQRPKCTYPSCGKFGHYEDNCWKAHPELRPRQAWGYGRGRRGRVGFGHRGRRSTVEGTQAENEWPLPPTSAWQEEASTPPFRLFDLPQEIQDRIYNHLYAKKYGASVFIVDNSDDVRSYRRHGFRKYLYLNTTSYSAELTCKKIRNDTHLLRKDAFNGHLQVKFHEDYGWQALERLCVENFTWLRTRVTDIKMVGFSGRAIRGNVFNATTWQQDLDLLKHFPQVRTIEIAYDITKYRANMDGIESDEWKRLQEPGADQAFLDGRRDNEFLYPARMLGIHELRKYVDQSFPECAIYMNVHVQWMSDWYYRVYEESVKFLVKSDGMEAVERH